ncbi:hypothetical protein H9Y05_01550 [Crocinitomicaceae bacterium CZZ-1]|uniref:Uncharacterized protein n=1 Tax=Taishania pollutisoli TaxID=2766479 RepID=A0A8J6P455_9FLAO|nr:hypothetical protein [Taishania pollutisoli]MBC9811147.1 hypothetical protein [Taishania pollutisoli]MBX2947937.1 hypothetical protein [Crocinitomicaceae bacterium]NGF76753.1 hypothetical protein [Fluviicola sp. SGL-29]
MKIIALSFFFTALINVSFSQTTSDHQENSSNKLFFTQCLINNLTEANMDELKARLSANTEIKTIRINPEEKRLFILTNPIETLNNSILLGWIGDFSDTISCIEIGVWGVDQVSTFPFSNCE